MLIVTGVGAVALLLSQLTSIVTDARRFPAEVTKTTDQLFEWYGAYDEWKGRWTYFPEGNVGMADMKLTTEPFHLMIDTSAGGDIGGSIETKGICERAPYFDTLLIEGKIGSASKAEVDVFDYVGGHKQLFAKIALRRTAGEMVVQPVEDPLGMFQKETRIALAPTDLTDTYDFEHICPEKRWKIIHKALGAARETSGKRKPVEQFITDQK